MKTLMAAATWCALASPALALDTLTHQFATCTGRLSAELEFSWLVGDGDADQISSQRSRFEGLLDAITPETLRRDALARRIDAKMAHSKLLTTAQFSENPKTQVWARARSKHEISTCLNMLLDS